MDKRFRPVGFILALGMGLIAFNLGGCGGDSGGGTTTPGTSGNATRGATSTALSAGDTGANSGGSSAASLAVQALTASRLAALKSATVDIPEETASFSVDCSSGSVSGAVTISGSATFDDDTMEVTALDIDMNMITAFDSCTPEDIESTTDVTESDYTLDGTLTGTGSISADEDSASFQVAMDGNLGISGTCTGTLTFDASISGSITENSESCSGSGTVSGTMTCPNDGTTTVNCTLSGDCDDPQLSGTGCE